LIVRLDLSFAAHLAPFCLSSSIENHIAHPSTQVAESTVPDSRMLSYGLASLPILPRSRQTASDGACNTTLSAAPTVRGLVLCLSISCDPRKKRGAEGAAKSADGRSADIGKLAGAADIWRRPRTRPSI
jgi:hypothetical protein